MMLRTTSKILIIVLLSIQGYGRIQNCLEITDNNDFPSKEDVQIPTVRYNLAAFNLNTLMDFNCIVIINLSHTDYFFKKYKKFLILVKRVVIFTAMGTNVSNIETSLDYHSKLPKELFIMAGLPVEVNFIKDLVLSSTMETIRTYLSKTKHNSHYVIRQNSGSQHRSSKLRVANFHYPPFTLKLQDRISGVEVNLIKTLAKSMGLEVEFNDPKDAKMWGQTVGLENQTYTGVIGEVYRSDVDIGAGQYFITNERLKLFDMQYYDIDGYCFLVKQPSAKSNWAAIIQPFQFRVWIGIVVSFLAICLFMFTWARFKTDEGLEPVSAAIYIYGATLGQNFPVFVKGNRLRVFIVLALLTGFVLSSVYRGKILAFLTIEIKPDPINHIFELLDYPGNVASYDNFLKDRVIYEQRPKYRKLEEKLIALGDPEQDFGQAGQGSLVIVDSRRSLNYQIRQRFVDKTGQSQMHIMNECWQNYHTSLLLSKHSNLTPFLESRILRIIEAGLIDKWIKDEMDRAALKDKFRKKSISSVSNLSITHFQTVPALLGICLLISSAIFAYEYCVGKSRPKHLSHSPI